MLHEMVGVDSVSPIGHSRAAMVNCDCDCDFELGWDLGDRLLPQ